MPVRAPRPCANAVRGCAALVELGYCSVCKAAGWGARDASEYESHRASPSARGYDRRWQRASKAQLVREPLCRDCAAVRLVVAATQTDHIVPLAQGGRKYDAANLQSLCASCHSRKTRAENAGE